MRTRLFVIALLVLAASAVAVPALQAAPTCTIGWTGGAGTSAWGTAGNWNENRLPGGTDHVCLDQPAGGTVVLSTSAQVLTIQGAQTLRLESGTLTVDDTGGEAILNGFEQTGGTLTGAGTLRIGSNFDWTGGSHVGGGLLQVDGTTHIHPGNSVLLGVSRRLQTASGSWTSGRIEGHNNMVWTITGTFDMRAEDGYGDYSNQNNSTVPTIRVTSTGTLVKTTVTPSSPQDTSFDTDVEFGIDNDGVVRAEAGRLRFGNGSTGATGHFESTTGELVFYGGDTFLMDGATFDGVELSGGRLDVPAGGLFSGTDLHQSGGTIGGAGTLQADGLEWTGGAMDGSGLTRDVGTGHIHPASSVLLAAGRGLETKHGAWSTGRIEAHNRAVWTVTGTFDLRAETGWGDFVNQDNTALPKIVVAPTGHVVKTATSPLEPSDTTHVEFAIDNDGDVETLAGRLRFEGGGGETTGDFASTGAGRTELAAGTFTVGDGTFDGFEVTGSARVEVPTGKTYSGLDLWQSGGTLGGQGTLASSGTFDWTGGGMDDTALTRSTGTTHIHPASSVLLARDHRLETKHGSWTSGRFEVHNRAQWTNTGTFDMRAEDGWVDFVNQDNTAQPVLHNTGSILKTAVSDAEPNENTDVEMQLDNDGTIDTQAGRLRFQAGGGETTGSLGSTGSGRTVLNGGTFTIGTGTFDGFEVSGSARVEVAEGATYSGLDLWQSGGTIAGKGTLASSGTFHWTGGTMEDSGLTRSTGTTHIHPASVVVLGRPRSLETKEGSWTTGRFEVHNRAVWTNTGTFDMRAEDGWADYVNQDNTGPHPLLHNTGTILKTAVSDAEPNENTDVEFQIDNDGTVDTQAGRLRFREGGGESTGSFASTGSGRTVLDGGTFTLGSGTFDGFEVAGGRVDVADGKTYSGLDLWQSGGTIGGTGTLAVSGTFDWTGGATDGAGLTKVTGTTAIHPASLVVLGRPRSLETNDGSWTSGRFEVHNRAVWTNKGTFDMRAEDGWLDYVNQDNTGPHPLLHNTGTIVKTAVSDAEPNENTDVEMQLDNDGTIDTKAGRLRFREGGGESTGAFRGTGAGRTVLDAGTFTAAGGSFDGLLVSGGRLNITAGTTFAGEGLDHSGGVIGGPGDVTISGVYDWSGGGIDGTGTTKVTGTTLIHPASHVVLGLDRKLETGDGSWTSGRIEVHNRSRWANAGAFDLRSETGFVDFVNQDNTAGSALHNTGTFTRTDGDPAAPPVDLSIELPVDNDGSITSQSGKIYLNGGGLNTSTGIFGASLNGGTFRFGPGASFAPGGELLSAATLELADGVDISLAGGLIAGNITGNGDVSVPAGEVRWTGGTIGGTGLLHVAEGARLVLEGGYRSLAGRRLLQNEGEIEWTAGALTILAAATLLNEGTLDASDELQYITTSGLSSEGRASFINTGTIVKSAGTGTTYLQNLENRGLLDIRSGLVYSDGFRQTAAGTIRTTLGGTARGTQFGGLDSWDPRLGGRLAVRLADGYTPADGDKFAIVTAGNDQGVLAAEPLSLPGGGTLTAAVENGSYTYTASVPQTAPRAAEAEPVAGAVAPATPAPAVRALQTADSTVRLAPGGQATVTLPQGATVQVLTKTRRASVRVDKKARKLRVRLRRSARGKRLKLRYRVVAADGTRSKITTLTVRIARR